MVWQQPSDDEPSSRTGWARAVRVARIPGGGDLPGWESFPPQDRCVLVRLLVQTARRQVRNRPTVRLGGERG